MKRSPHENKRSRNSEESYRQRWVSLSHPCYHVIKYHWKGHNYFMLQIRVQNDKLIYFWSKYSMAFILQINKYILFTVKHFFHTIIEIFSSFPENVIFIFFVHLYIRLFFVVVYLYKLVTYFRYQFFSSNVSLDF